MEDQRKASKKELPVKRRFFAAYYCITLNKKRAAILAGYSEKTAAEAASRMLKDERVKKLIEEYMSEAAEKLGITQEKVLDALWSNAQRCRQEEPVLDREGNPIGQYKFDSSGANKALELVGRHLQMFVDKKEIAATVTHEDALKKLMGGEIAGEVLMDDEEE